MSDESDSRARARLWGRLAPLGNIVGVVCGLVGVVTDLFSSTVRLAIAIAGAVLLVGASIGSTLATRVQRTDRDEIEQLKANLMRAGAMDRDLPDHALRMLAPVVFRSGSSWRLTIFVLEVENGVWFARPRIRCASTEIYESIGRQRIPLAMSILRELTVLQLPANGELADAPDRGSRPEEWRTWQASFIADQEIIDALRMPSRKYAWCATRQVGQGGQTIALVAETIQPSGIKADVLGSDLLAPILEMVLRLVDLPEAVTRT